MKEQRAREKFEKSKEQKWTEENEHESMGIQCKRQNLTFLNHHFSISIQISNFAMYAQIITISFVRISPCHRLTFVIDLIDHLSYVIMIIFGGLYLILCEFISKALFICFHIFVLNDPILNVITLFSIVRFQIFNDWDFLNHHYLYSGF